MIPKICLLLGCAALACGAQPAKIFPYDYSQEDLPNGLRLITVPTDYANIVATYIVVRTGSRNEVEPGRTDRKSTRLNSSHLGISYAVFCLKKKKTGHGAA